MIVWKKFKIVRFRLIGVNNRDFVNIFILKKNYINIIDYIFYLILFSI